MGEASLTGEVRHRLSDFLRERREEIMADWEAAVRKVRVARNLDRPLLLDHMPHFLADLAEYVDELRSGAAPEPPDEYPRIHALERLELGYDLSEVVIEYAILRRCITDLAVRQPSAHSQELPRLHAAIDHAISTSVMRYTEARERTLRALDRISSAALIHHDVEALLPTTLRAFLETTASVDAVALALREDDDLFHVRAEVGFPGPLTDAPLSPDGFTARVATSGTPIFMREASVDASVSSDPLCAPGTHALYGVPLLFGNRVMGVAVMGSRSSYEFSQEDQFLFRTMVSRVAALISQARLDAEVRRRVAELEAVIESISEAVFVGDAGGIKRANAAALELLGYDSVEELDRDSTKLVTQLDIRHLDGTPVTPEEDSFRRALRGESVVAELLVRSHATGEEKVVRASTAPIHLGDRIIGAVGVSTDITARIEEEAELRAALQFRERILGVLSHDLRNPLSVILTSASMLERSGTLDEKQKLAVQRVVNNARRIERLVHDLLDYTRTRHGRGIPITPRDTDVLALCHQVVEGLQLLHPTRALRLTAHGQTHAQVDPDRAMQVVGNLVSNALRYSPPDSPVDISLREVDDSLELSVHNEGPPIPAEVLPRLFDAFQRGVPDGKSDSDGLGLGLYIVQQIVAAHGGTIDVRSEDGSGTAFSVRWPR